MFTTEQIDRLLNQGANVLSEDGEKIGSIGQVFVDNEDAQPSWVTVRTGLFGMSESFVPLEGARTEGNDIVVPYSKDHVKDAPRIDADRPLEPAEEDRLYQHYQLDTGRTYTEATTVDSGPGREHTGAPAATGSDATARTEQRDATAPDRTGAPTEQRDTIAPDRTQAPAAGYDTTAPTEQRDTIDDATTPAAQRATAAPDRTGAPAAAGTPGYDTAAPDRTAAPTAAAGHDTTAPTEHRETAAPDRTGAPAAAGTPGYDTAAPDRTAAPTVAATAAATVAATAAATGAYDASAQRDTEREDTAAPDRTQAPIAAGAGTAGYDTTAPIEHGDTGHPDTAQRADTAQRDTGAAAASGRARLRKYVTTEQVTKTVPVQREEVRIEREPITEENRDEASNRPDQDDERDVILHEERLIVTKETVPVERVHIGTETVTEEVTINEEVRKEHIDTDGPEEGRG